MVVDIGRVQMWKGFEKFRRVPSVQGAGEVLAWAENAELLEFVVHVVENNLVAKKFLMLSDEASCEAWLLFEMGGVESPLVLKKRFQVLNKGGWEALNS